jgi:hypothetical protein
MPSKVRAPKITCPVCGREGYLRSQYMRCGKPNCKCARGQLHGPYPFVEHYLGYDTSKRRHKSERCYLSKKRLQEQEWRRIVALLSAYTS